MNTIIEQQKFCREFMCSSSVQIMGLLPLAESTFILIVFVGDRTLQINDHIRYRFDVLGGNNDRKNIILRGVFYAN